MQTQTLFWAGNAKLDFHIISCFETPSVMTCRQGYICWHPDWLDDNNGCRCFSGDRWGDTRHRIQLRCIPHPLFRNMMYLWNELSAVADDSIFFKNKPCYSGQDWCYAWASRNLFLQMSLEGPGSTRETSSPSRAWSVVYCVLYCLPDLGCDCGHG